MDRKQPLNQPSATAHESVRRMDRRRFLELGLAGSLAVASGALAWGGCSRGAAHPDVILIMVDTLRADHLGCYGYERPVSPAIDALAADSVLFERVYAAAPWTTASVAAMMTSQFPSSLGIRDRVVGFDARHPSLAGTLRESGYRTEGIVSVDMLSAKLGFGAGFDAYDDRNYTGRAGVTAPQVVDKARALFASATGKPVFSFIHVFDPHYNFIQHPQWNFHPDYRGELVSNQPIMELWERLGRLTADDMKFLVSAYDSEIAFTDRHLGVFLDDLRRQGRYDDALIILTGDHGEEMRERGWIGHSISVHKEQVHVPLLVKLPGGKGARVPTPVSLLDLMPTLLRYLDVKAPRGLEGTPHDLTNPRSIATRPVFSETFHAQRHRPGGMDPIALAAVQVGNHKLIHNGMSGKAAVYDLQADPLERSPRRPAQNDEDRALVELINDWHRHVKAKSRGAQTEDAQERLDEEQLKRLKSLGYV